MARLANLKTGLILVTLLLFFSAPALLSAANFKVKSVVVTGGPAPEGGVFTQIGFFSMNNPGAIAFLGGTASSQGIYLASDVMITRLIKPGDVFSGELNLPGLTGKEDFISPPIMQVRYDFTGPLGLFRNPIFCDKVINGFNVFHPLLMNDSGDLVFKVGDTTFQGDGNVVRFSGGTLTRLHCPALNRLIATELSEEGFARINSANASAVNNAGTIVLSLFTTETTFIFRTFLIDGETPSHFPLIDTAAPGGGTIVAGSIVDLNDSGDLLISFTTDFSTFPPRGGISLNSTTIALIGGSAGPGKTFRQILGADLNNLGEVVFVAQLSDFRRTIFRWAPNSTPVALIREGDPILEGKPLFNFGSVAINDNGDIAFMATFFGSPGIFLLSSKGGLSKVVLRGDKELGGASFAGIGEFKLNNKAVIAFRAGLSNGKTGIFLAGAGLETEFVDPVSDLLADATITSDEKQLAEMGRLVTGIAADGAARVVVRVKTGQPGTVEFLLVDENGSTLPPSNFNGSLSQVSEELGSGSVSVPAAEVEGFGPMAFAAYHAPMDFANGPNSKEAGDPDRKVYIRIRLTTSTGETVESTESLKIVRPPVVLVHGLWSDDRTWDSFAPLITDPTLSVHRINYKDSNAREIGFNATLVLREIKKIVEDYKVAAQVAAVRADLVTHSMGGLLGRMLPVFSSSFLRDDNFTKGDVHKLINIGTPHRGSELAEKLRTKKNRFLCRNLLSARNAPIDQGAIDDLSPGSEALRVLNGFPSLIPVHNNVGIASPLQKQVNSSGFLLDRLQSPFVCGEIIPPGGFDELFKGDDSDLLVSATSQRGGLTSASSAATNFPPNGPNLVHTTANGLFDVADGEAELESPAVSLRVIKLLHLPVNSPEFISLSP